VEDNEVHPHLYANDTQIYGFYLLDKQTALQDRATVCWRCCSTSHHLWCGSSKCENCNHETRTLLCGYPSSFIIKLCIYQLLKMLRTNLQWTIVVSLFHLFWHKMYAPQTMNSDIDWFLANHWNAFFSICLSLSYRRKAMTETDKHCRHAEMKISHCHTIYTTDSKHTSSFCCCSTAFLKTLSNGLISWNSPTSSQLLRNLVGVGVWSTTQKCTAHGNAID